MKPCSKCGVPKELICFHINKNSKDGHRNICKSCVKKYREANKEHYAEYGKKYREANKEHRNEYGKKYREANKEHCNEYGKKYHEANKEHRNEYGKKYREANKEHRNEYGKKYYEVNKEHYAEYGKKYHEANKEHRNERGKIWKQYNLDKTRSHSAKRRSIKLKARPLWLTDIDTMQIQDFYTLAKMHSEIMGKEYHVDHIHALQAPKVVMFEGEMMPLICGLDIPGNLQILTAEQNLQKSNKFEPYVFSECDFTQLWQA